jgi:hypothetical protein
MKSKIYIFWGKKNILIDSFIKIALEIFNKALLEYLNFYAESF